MTSEPEQIEAAAAPGEHERVLQWRYDEIRRLGMGRMEARLLADGGADLNLLRRLVESGCPPETAVRIVL